MSSPLTSITVAAVRLSQPLCLCHSVPSQVTISSESNSSFPLSSMPRRIGILLLFIYLINLPWSLANPLSLPATTSPRAPGLHLPLSRREINTTTPKRERRRGAIGLGDYFDVCVSEYATAASSSRKQNIQCTSSSRLDACTARHR